MQDNGQNPNAEDATTDDVPNHVTPEQAHASATGWPGVQDIPSPNAERVAPWSAEHFASQPGWVEKDPAARKRRGAHWTSGAFPRLVDDEDAASAATDAAEPGEDDDLPAGWRSLPRSSKPAAADPSAADAATSEPSAWRPGPPHAPVTGPPGASEHAGSWFERDAAEVDAQQASGLMRPYLAAGSDADERPAESSGPWAPPAPGGLEGPTPADPAPADPSPTGLAPTAPLGSSAEPASGPPSDDAVFPYGGATQYGDAPAAGDPYAGDPYAEQDTGQPYAEPPSGEQAQYPAPPPAYGTDDQPTQYAAPAPGQQGEQYPYAEPYGAAETYGTDPYSVADPYAQPAAANPYTQADAYAQAEPTTPADPSGADPYAAPPYPEPHVVQQPFPPPPPQPYEQGYQQQPEYGQAYPGEQQYPTQQPYPGEQPYHGEQPYQGEQQHPAQPHYPAAPHDPAAHEYGQPGPGYAPPPQDHTPPPQVHQRRHAPPMPAQPMAPPPTAEEFAARRAHRPQAPEATMGMPALVRRVSFGMVAPAPSRKERGQREAVARVRRNFGGLRQITVVNPKGGAGKTVAALMTAMTFGQNRGGYVLAWDNNETQGTLGMRAQQDFHTRTVRDVLHDLPTFMGVHGRVGDLMSYVRSQGEAMFDVLASDESATAGEMLTARAFADIREVVSRFYKLIIVDTGNNVRAENWQAAIDATDQLVVTMSARGDSAETAARMLDHLEQTGRNQLVREAVTVVSMPASRKDVDLPAIQRHFSARTRQVLIAPYERLLDSGEPIRYSELTGNSRQAWLKIAAAIAEGL